jgi:hypothetical protein
MAEEMLSYSYRNMHDDRMTKAPNQTTLISRLPRAWAPARALRAELCELSRVNS